MSRPRHYAITVTCPCGSTSIRAPAGIVALRVGTFWCVSCGAVLQPNPRACARPWLRPYAFVQS
jgi:hypothetical protein